MRNLKKVLSVLLVVVMMATAMVPAFAAETYTYSTQAKALYDVGLFKGVSTTEYVPDLGSALTREQGIAIVVRLLGKADAAAALSAADADAALAAFGDAKDVESTLKNSVAYAVKNGLVIGDGKSVNPKGAMLGKDLATIILRNLGYTVDAASYDVATATLADKGGLTAAEATKFAAKELIRDDLVGIAFGSLSAKYSTGKTVIEQLIADKVVDEAKAIAAGVYVKPVTATVTAAATGAKKITVTFSSAVDSTKAAITVKNGTVAVNTDSVVFAADNKSAVVTTTTKLSKGTYTVSVAGLTDTALTATVVAEDEKVTKINISSPKAPRLAADPKKAKVSYEVLNQYSEKMTGQSVTWTISTGIAVSNEVNNVTNCSFEITAAGGLDFIPGAIVYITGVQANSGTVINGQVEIALASQADSVTFKGVWDKTNSKLVDLPAGFADSRYVLLFTVNDQYGNAMSAPDLTKLVFTSNNPLFVDASAFVVDTDVTIDSTAYKAVVLKPGTMVNNGGTVTIQAISTVTGKISTFTATAQAKAEVKTFTMSAPTDLATEGKSVYVPFTAVDQYGNAITKYSDLNGKVTLTPAYDVATNVGLQFELQDDATAKLKYTAPATGASKDIDLPVYLTSVVTNGGNFSSLMISVKETAVPSAVIGLDSDKSTSVAAYNYVDIYAKNLIIQDQYGRTIKDADVNTWLDLADSSIVVTSTKPDSNDTSPFSVKLNGAGSDAATQVINASTAFVRINCDAGSVATTATENIKFIISYSDTAATKVDASTKTLAFAEVEKSAYTSYEVADAGLMYNDSDAATVTDAAYNKTLKVYGVKADGTKVLLPATDYTVSAGSKLVTTNNVVSDIAAGGYAAADFKDASNVYTDVKVNLLVTVNDSVSGSAIAILTKELVLSNKAPKATTVTFKTDKVTDGKAIVNPVSGAFAAADLKAVIDTVKNQYAVATTEAPVITITSLTKVSGSTFTVSNNATDSVSVTGAKLGDKFTVEFKYVGGTTATVNFTVGK